MGTSLSQRRMADARSHPTMLVVMSSKSMRHLSISFCPTGNRVPHTCARESHLRQLISILMHCSLSKSSQVLSSLRHCHLHCEFTLFLISSTANAGLISLVHAALAGGENIPEAWSALRLRMMSPGAASASAVGSGERAPAPTADPGAPATPHARLAPPCARTAGDPTANTGNATISTCPVKHTVRDPAAK